MIKSLSQQKKKDVNVLHAELGHPSEDITQASGQAMGFHIIGTLKPFQDCTLGKAKKPE